jgi:fucose 4-O-acetylase-like acetyltransferase
MLLPIRSVLTMRIPLIYYICFVAIIIIVARAPRNVNRKIPTLAELENDARAAIMMGEVLNDDVIAFFMLCFVYKINYYVNAQLNVNCIMFPNIRADWTYLCC